MAVPTRASNSPWLSLPWRRANAIAETSRTRNYYVSSYMEPARRHFTPFLGGVGNDSVGRDSAVTTSCESRSAIISGRMLPAVSRIFYLGTHRSLDSD